MVGMKYKLTTWLASGWICSDNGVSAWISGTGYGSDCPAAD
jgi:hypothetical protein